MLKKIRIPDIYAPQLHELQQTIQAHDRFRMALQEWRTAQEKASPIPRP